MKQVVYFSSFVLLLCVTLLSISANAEPDTRRGGRGPKGKDGHGGHGGHGGPGGHKGHDKSDCKCADKNYELVEVFTSTAATGTKRTECVPKKICYKVCTTNPCTTVTEECISAADISAAREKPGACPTVGCDYMVKGSTKDTCSDDSDCSGQKKCCSLSTTSTPPGTTKLCTEPVGAIATTEMTCATCPATSQTTSACTGKGCRYKACDRCQQVCTPDAQNQVCPSGFKCCQCSDTGNNYCQYLNGH